ncbi:MAG: discoidin domain-containing protein [Catonella sp.]
MRKRRSLIAALTAALLIQGIATDVTVSRVYAKEVRSDSVTQMSTEKEVVNITSFSKQSKRTENFNTGWKFYLGDSGKAEIETFDDSKWKGIDLPHDYSIHQDFQKSMEAESGYLDGGIGWYRKHFSLTPDMKDKEIRVDFDGVYMDATVWVNGKLLGSHPYGYTPFSFNLTKYLKFDGRDNVIAVKVNHKTPSSRWYSGSGIYRDVKLQIMDKLHVDLNGVKVETPSLADNQTDVAVKIKTKLVNALLTREDVRIKAKIFKKGNEKETIGETVSEVTGLNAGETSSIELDLTVHSPILWDTEHPELYTVQVEILKGDEVADTYDTDFGFRWFSANKNKGTYLNGKPIKLKGVCMHHDQGALGAAAYKRAIERQVEILQEMGCNSIRVTHNPASQALIDVCNEKGILLIEEMFDGWMYHKNGNNYDYATWFNKTIGQNNEIVGGKVDMTWAEFDMKSAIKRGQNAPSIIMWSLGNEINEGAGGRGYNDKARDLIRWGEETDSTRMLTIGSNRVKNHEREHIDIANQLTAVGGMSGTNYSNGNSYDDLHRNYPEWLMYGSETASSVNSRGIYTNLNSNSLDADKQLTSYDVSRVNWGALASEAWYDVITRDFVAGEYVWTGFDYIGEPTPANGTGRGAATAWPSPKNSYFGIVDTAGFPKDSYYFYQSQWNDKKHTLHVLPAWNENAVFKRGNDKKVKVVVYSDAAKVELKLNGKSLGKKEFNENTTAAGYKYKTVKGRSGHQSLYMTWDVPFEAGTLEAVAYDEEGNVITDTQGRSVVKTVDRAAKLVVKADRTNIKADGKDLSYVTVDVTDEEGNIVPDAKNEVTFSVEGEGEIEGTDNGSSPDHTPYNSLIRKAHAGKVLAIVKSGKRSGTVTVRAKAQGLTEGMAVINTEPVSGAEDKNVIESFYMIKHYYVKKGNYPVLPNTLTARYTDGKTVEEKVEWDKISDELINQTGSFEVTGTVGENKVTVNVTIIDEIGGLLNYSTTTPKNTPVNLPELRPAVLQDGKVLQASFPVVWEKIPETAYENAGIFTVNGEANVLGKAVKVKATIRVQEATISIGDNVSGVAKLSQNIPEGHRSDRLEAINDGSTTIAQGSDKGNDSVWSNWKYSQEGNTKAELTFAFDTQQTIGEAVIYFGRDNLSMRYPDEGKTKLQVSEDNVNWKDVEVKEIIGNEVNNSRVKPYTYKFSPVSATFVRLCITNSAAATGTRWKACTGITEVELKKAVGSYSENTEAGLAALTVNDEVLSADVLVSGVYETPAQMVEINKIETIGNAAYTIIPAYKNEVKILIESEDHKTTGEFVIKLDKEVEDNGAQLEEYPVAKLKATAVSEFNSAGGKGDGPASYVLDNDIDTHWHTNWSKHEGSTEAERTINLELAEVQEVAELLYYPRTFGGLNGFITEYRVEVKPEGKNEWVIVSKGSWKKPEGEADWYEAEFNEPVRTKDVRLVAVHTHADSGRDRHASVAELRVMLTDKRPVLKQENTQIEIEGLTDGKIEVTKVSEKYPVKPAVKVKFGDVILRQGLDYKLKYLNNTETGVAKVEITGIIKYRGKLEKEFEIVKKPAELETIFILTKPEKTVYKVGEKFNPKGLKLTLNYTDESTGEVSYEGNESDFSFIPSLEELLKAGARKITVIYKGKAVYIDIVVEENSYPGPVVPMPEDGNKTEDNTDTIDKITDTKPAAPVTEQTKEITEDKTPEGAVKKDAFTILFTKLNKENTAKAQYIQKKVVRKKGLTLEQFAKELTNKKIIAGASKKEVKRLLKGVKVSKWSKSYVAALIKTGVLKKSDFKNIKKKISEEFAAEILEKLMLQVEKDGK